MKIHNKRKSLFTIPFQFGFDGDFQIKRFIELVNSDLANTIGNLLNRTLVMAQKWFKKDIPIHQSRIYPNELKAENDHAVEKYIESFNQNNFKEAAEAIIELSNSANLYLNEKQPWKLIKVKENLSEVSLIIYSVLDTCRIIGLLLQPIIPDMSNRMLDQLNVNLQQYDWKSSLNTGLLTPHGLTNEAVPVMSKLEIPDTL